MSYGLAVYDSNGNEVISGYVPNNVIKVIPMEYTYDYFSTKVYITTHLPPLGGGIIKYIISGSGFYAGGNAYVPTGYGDVIIGQDSISYALVGNNSDSRFTVGKQSGSYLVVLNDRGQL